MRLAIKEIEQAIASIKKYLARYQIKGPADYPEDPVGYANNILRVRLTETQEEILEALLLDPYRVMVPAGHGVGKTFLAAVACNWWYDSFNPGVVISTAPDHRSVCDLLWTEIRLQRSRAGLGDLMPAAPEMRTSPDHYAKGFTALNGNSFQGRHPEKLLIVFDEAAGIDPVFWQTCETMFHRRYGFAWLAILNPVDTGCQAFLEDQMTSANPATGEIGPKWRRFSLDALEHPNIKGKGPGDEPVIKNAISWHQVNEWVQIWCDSIPTAEATPFDLEWPTGSGKWHRQGPIFLARCRGRWPTGQAFSVWSDAVWTMACERILPIPLDLLPEIGCDVARFGDDFTSFHVRWGHTSLYHESRNGWSTDQIAGNLKVLAEKFADMATSKRPETAQPISWKQIAVKIDDDGVGGGVTDQYMNWGGQAIPISAGSKSISGRYPNKRSELWFQVADRALGGMVALGLLPKALLSRMRQQALAVQYRLNAAGMREVEAKEITKEKIGRSPDDCFVAGTMIATGDGERAIEDVRIGDRVWTRRGLRQVVKAGVTHREKEVATACFSNGRSLTGTLAHPVFVRGKGWIRLDALNLADIVEVCENPSSSTASSSSAIQTAKACRLAGIITQSTKSFARSMGRCINLFGGIITGQSPKGTTSTTRMTSGIITISAISNVSRPRSIDSGMLGRFIQKLSSILTELGRSQRSGTLLRLEENGILNRPSSRDLVSASQGRAFAKSVEKCTQQSILGHGFAVKNASKEITIETKSAGLNPCALYAELNSFRRHQSLEGSVPIRVLHVTQERTKNGPRREKVFNLTVESAHEYYANGILVHNCDALNLAYLEGYEFESARFIEGRPIQVDPSGKSGNWKGSQPHEIQRTRERRKIW